MVFKAGWEKTSQQFLPPVALLEQMVLLAFPSQKLVSYELINGGCANLNIKIQVAGENTPFILRIYIRDKEAAFREQQLATLLKDSIPIPLVYYLGDVENYRFAVTEFMNGITLRDLLLEDELSDLSHIMDQVARLLVKIAAISFPKAGFFDKKLNIITEISGKDLLAFAKICLKDNNVVSKLSNENISSINYYLDKYGYLLAAQDQKNLVHGDFDPANILVAQKADSWKVSGILDWEFAFSGSVLWDVANMLRYAHKMPQVFKDAFLNGLKQGGVVLPEKHEIIVLMLNVVSILDLLKRVNAEKSPKQVVDLRELIVYILSVLNEKKSIKEITVISYNPDWPRWFQIEAAKILEGLSDNIVEIHHVGSTSVSGLSAKPIIDMIAVVKELAKVIRPLENLGFNYRGEYNLPMHFGFNKRGEVNVNLHVFEEGNPEIELNLLFRNFLRNNEVALKEYALLKNNLLQNKNARKKIKSMFTGYTLGKDAFVRKILKQAGFNKLRMMKCTHYAELEAAKTLIQKYFPAKMSSLDSAIPTFEHPDHIHLVLYLGVNIVGYAHLVSLPDRIASIRMMVVESEERGKGIGSDFLELIQKWLRLKDYKSLYVVSSTEAIQFYIKHKFEKSIIRDSLGEGYDLNYILMDKKL